MSRALVTKEMTREAARQVRDLGPRPAMVKLSRLEPELISHVNKGMSLIWRKLRSYGLINAKGMNGIDETLYPTILGVVISSLEALRTAQSSLGPRLAHHRSVRNCRDGRTSEGARVSAEILEEVEVQVWPLGRDRVMRELFMIEPELQRFILRVYGSVRDGLVDYKLPDSVEELLAEQLMLMGAICTFAARVQTP
jgi:hypothetical protein